MTRLNSLRWRLMVALLLVFGLGFGVSAIFSYGEAYGTLKELRKRTLQGQAQELLLPCDSGPTAAWKSRCPWNGRTLTNASTNRLRIAFMTQITRGGAVTQH